MCEALMLLCILYNVWYCYESVNHCKTWYYIHMKERPKVALIGRVNVGKSTLFNKLIGERKALESSVAGTTRDYNHAPVAWRDVEFELVDTGGFVGTEPDNDIDAATLRIASEQAEAADILILVVSHIDGLLGFDIEILHALQRLTKPIIVAINKVDKPKDHEGAVLNFAETGITHTCTMSATTGQGTGDLLDLIATTIRDQFPTGVISNDQSEEHLYKALTPTDKHIKGQPDVLKLAIIGQPNVGKSSLLNALVGKERAIVSPTAHTTRDAHDEFITHNNQTIQVIDTAGIRRRKQLGDVLEKFSIDLSLRNLRSAHVALLVIDISQPITYQDKHLSERLVETGNSIIVIANKWDLIPDKHTNTINEYTTYIHKHMPWLMWAPIIFTSAETKQRVTNILDTTVAVWTERFRRIDDNALDKFIKKIIAKHKPSRDKGVAHPYVYRMRQTGVNPPHFELTIKYKKSLHESYVRFIKNQLREQFGFAGTPIKIYIQSIK